MKPRFHKLNDTAIFLEHYHGYDLYFVPGLIPDLIAFSEEGGLAGFSKGQTGECSILAYAYGLAKKEGLYVDIAEREFLLNSAVGWVVQGETGEGLNKIKWPAFFTLNKVRAIQVQGLLNKQAETWKNNRNNLFGSGPPYGWSQLDPNMKCEYLGTDYSVIPIKHESDPNRISFAQEICPECNTQVYDTPNGMICERGHVMIT